MCYSKCLPRGSVCDILHDPCQLQPCLNHGTCIKDVDTYACLCEEGFAGKDCEMDVDQCEQHQCQNNATCIEARHIDFEVSSSTMLYFCECPDGFRGEYCEENIDDCESSGCEAGGQCIDGIGTFSCICPPGTKYVSHLLCSILNVHQGAGSVRKKLTSVCRRLVTRQQPVWTEQVSKTIEFILPFKIHSHVSVLADAVGHFVKSKWIHVWTSRALEQPSAGQRGILHAAFARQATWALLAILVGKTILNALVFIEVH